MKGIIQIQTKTPVFIGNGETVKPLSYWSNGNKVHIINESRFFSGLNATDQQKYLSWLEPILNKMEQLRRQIDQVKQDQRGRFFGELRNAENQLSLQHFLKNVLRINPQAALSSSSTAYSVPASVLPEKDGFRACLKDSLFCPYIPGTEIKGAVRTSVIYSLLNEETNYKWFGEQIRKIPQQGRGTGWYLKKISADMEARLLRGRRSERVPDDPKFDFFRLVRFSDSQPMDSTRMKIELSQSLGTSRFTKTSVEAISADSHAACGYEIFDGGSIGIPFLLEELHLQGMTLWLSMEKILEACFVHSRDVLDEEENYFSDVPHLRRVIQDLADQNKPDSPLLRIGQGQGYQSTTVTLAIKKREPQFYYSAIAERLGRRQSIGKMSQFPKTRRVILNRAGNPDTFLGWIKVTGQQETVA